MPPPITDVPPDKVGEVVQDFIDFDNVRELQVVRQANGKFTVSPLR
ncbi:MAG: hypothetical protein HY043_06400 [Verrucomicrobia bacterium]|nr:hypothetical protein [Verrucomicrobiota bacterium]